MLDEADSTLIDANMDVQAGFVVGLTATSLDNEVEGCERLLLLKHLRYVQLDCGYEMASLKKDVQDVASVSKFLKLTTDMPRLIYCARDDQGNVPQWLLTAIKAVKDLTLMTDATDKAVYGKLEPNQVLV